jgi:hypothetical protein
MQDRAEDLAVQIVDAADFQQHRRDEMPCFGAPRRGAGRGRRWPRHRRRCPVLRLGVDDRADIGRQAQGSPTRSSSIAPLIMAITCGGDVFLHVKAAQRRTALPGRAEAGGHDIAHRLFGQRGRIDDHRVQPAGFGDQRRAGRHIGGHGAGDDLRGLGRAGEDHARHPRVRGQRRAHRAVLPGQQLQRRAGTPA